jgi:hypothetical protein
MLVISRKQHETITIVTVPEAGAPVADSGDQDVVEIRLIEIKRNRVRLAIKAPSRFLIWRGVRPKAGADDPAPEFVADVPEAGRGTQF